MATINFRYHKDDKQTLKDEAISLGYNGLSDYIISIIASRPKVKLTTKPKPVIKKKGKVREKVETRVSPEEKKCLLKICKEEGVTESSLLLRQVRILINNQPHFSKEEIKNLRSATNQLTAIGRNLNQIVARINSGTISDSKLGKPYMLQIKKNIDNQAYAIRNLIQKTKDRVVE